MPTCNNVFETTSALQLVTESPQPSTG